MRTRTANYFICKVRYEKTMESGLQKKVTESYVVDAMSFTEAEAKVIAAMSQYISGEYDVQEIDRAVFREIFFMDFAESDTDTRWYKAKLQFITIDLKSGKEKKSSVYYLTEGTSIESARKNIDEVMGGTMIDYVIVSLSETTILDVFEFEQEKAPEE